MQTPGGSNLLGRAVEAQQGAKRCGHHRIPPAIGRAAHTNTAAQQPVLNPNAVRPCRLPDAGGGEP